MAGEKSSFNYTPLLCIGGGILAYKFVLAPVLETLGLKDSAEEKAYNQSEVSNEGWNETFWKDTYDKKIPAIWLSPETALNAAKVFYGAIQGSGTNEDAIYQVLNQLKSRVQLSQIAYLYNKLPGNYRLVTDIADDMGDSDKKKVITIVNRLPKYK